MGVTLEEYEVGLKEQEQEVAKKLKQAHAEEYRVQEKERQVLKKEIHVLEKEKSETTRRLADTKSSHQNYIGGLEERGSGDF